jgi:hypothetical protein
MNKYLALVFAISSSAVMAQVVVVDGELAHHADGVFDVTIDVVDDAGTAVFSTTVASTTVTDGLFEVELDLTPASALLNAGAALTVDVSIDGVAARAQLGPVFAALQSSTAGSATSAAAADALGTIAPAELVQRSTVGTAGAVAIAFANLVDVPPGLADGVDNGTIDALGSGLSISAGTLRISGVTTAQIVDGTVPTAAIIDASIATVQLTGLAAADVATGALTGVHFADAAFASADVSGLTVSLFQLNSACSSTGSDDLVTTSTCTRRTCGGAGRVTCGTFNTCQDPVAGSTTCSNTLLGKMFAP